MEKLENIFSKENKEQPAAVQELWVKRNGTELSPMAVDDFSKFLMKRPEHRKGEMALHRPSREVPLEVIFFTTDDPGCDIVYLINHNYKKCVLEVTKLEGQEDKITPLLEEFGLTLSSK